MNTLKENNVPLLELSDIDFINKIAQRHPEQFLLAGKEVDHTPEMINTPEIKGGYAQTLTGNSNIFEVVELNKFIMGVLIFKWIYSGTEGDYKKLIAVQEEDVKAGKIPENEKLTFATFRRLHVEYTTRYPTEASYTDMIIHMVLHDLGKNKRVIEKLKTDKAKKSFNKRDLGEQSMEGIIQLAVKYCGHTIQEIAELIREDINVSGSKTDHDKQLLEVLEQAINADKDGKVVMFPSFQEMSDKKQISVVTSLRKEFDLAQFLQGESSPENLKGVQDMSKEDFLQFFDQGRLDLWGAAGGFVQNGSPIMTETNVARLDQIKDLGLEIIAGEISYLDAYKKYILLNQKKYFNLQEETEENYAITRIALMLRLTDDQKIDEIKSAMDSFNENDKNILINYLNRTGVDDGYAVLVYYSPAIFQNITGHAYFSKRKNGYKSAVTLGLKILLNVYKEVAPILDEMEGNGVYTLMASSIANKIKDESGRYGKTQKAKKRLQEIEEGSDSSDEEMEALQQESKLQPREWTKFTLLNHGGEGEMTEHNYSEDPEVQPETPQDKNIRTLCQKLGFTSYKRSKMLILAYDKSAKNIQTTIQHNLNKNPFNEDIQISFDNDELRKLYDIIHDDSTFLITLGRLIQEGNVKHKKPKNGSIENIGIANLLFLLSQGTNINNIEISLDSKGEIQASELKDINVDAFPQMSSLSELPGKTIIPGGIGGGSDVVQAWQLAQLLQLEGKKVPFVYSVRTEITGSQGPNGEMGESRVPEDAEEVSPGVYRIIPKSKMKGRALEPAVSAFIPVYLILITEGIELTSQIEFLNTLLPEGTELGDTTFLQCDTGGDCLYPFDSDVLEEAKQTPDQDLTVLAAFDEADLKGANKLSAIMATGVDTPSNVQEVLTSAQSKFYKFNETDSGNVLGGYTDIGMRGKDRDPNLYGKTPASLIACLEGAQGFTPLDQIPEKNVTSDINPWLYIVRMQKSLGGIFFQSLDKHLPAIGYRE